MRLGAFYLSRSSVAEAGSNRVAAIGVALGKAARPTTIVSPVDPWRGSSRAMRSGLAGGNDSVVDCRPAGRIILCKTQ